MFGDFVKMTDLSLGSLIVTWVKSFSNWSHTTTDIRVGNCVYSFKSYVNASFPQVILKVDAPTILKAGGTTKKELWF